MAERPLLILPNPGAPVKKLDKYGGGGPPRLPGRSRQAERLAPKFDAIREAFESGRMRLQAEGSGLSPEQVIVLETAGTVQDFVAAVRKVTGMEWLGEIEEEDIPPDDDFFEIDKKGQRRDKPIRGRVFLVFTNQQALSQLLSMWNKWKSGIRLDYGWGNWEKLFAQLKDIRPWGIKDRLLETGILDDWHERIENNEEKVPCEIELWFRKDQRTRELSAGRVISLVEELEGQIIGQALVEQIAYHAILAELPIAAIVDLLLEEELTDTALVHCEQIQFFRASGQMAGIITEDAREEGEQVSAPAEGELGEPILALFDGLPLQMHQRLNGRLNIDDPDNFETDYPARDRRHGTAMASLIIQGDLSAANTPVPRQIYVRPILKPDPKDWRTPRQEIVPENQLIVDLVHRAVRRMMLGEGGEPPSAPQVCIVNLSIGIRDRLFHNAMSPLARLLDWLAWEYRLLFVVSAGNHPHTIRVDVPREQIANLSVEELQKQVILSIAADTRNRRLLSPAEGLNILTIGATHHDLSDQIGVSRAMEPYRSGIPSPINAQGMGYRRSIKPEVFMPGGRVLMQERVVQSEPHRYTEFSIYTQTRSPGQRVAAPGPSHGNLSYEWYTRGTSNATALLSREAHAIYDVLEELRNEPGGDLIDRIPRALWLKALLTHTARWGSEGEILMEILKTAENGRQFKEYLTRLIGYGLVHPAQAGECSATRVTALCGGELQKEKSLIHRFPLPPSLSGKTGFRRLVITLAWFSPINPVHQGWRRADLWFAPPTKTLEVERQEADWRAVQRGTLQHEVLEGRKAAAYADDEHLDIQVSCREDAGILEDAVPYALAVTLEVAEEIGIDIYEEVQQRVRARIAVTA